MIAPKYSLETEQDVLETLMHFSSHTISRVQKALLRLTDDCFYNVDNRQIFQIIKDCFSKQKSFHFVDVLSLIPRDNSDLHATLSWMIDNYGKVHAGEAAFDNYVERLVTLATIRHKIALAQTMIADVNACVSPEECEEILSAGLNEIAGVSYRESKHGIDSMEIAEQFLSGEIVTPQKIKTSCEQLNHAFSGGIMPKSLIFIAAGSGVGKTGFSIFLLDAITRTQDDSHALFFSIEMEYKQIWMRHIGVCSGKTFDKLNYQEQADAVVKSAPVPIRIYDTNICRDVSDLDFILNTARLRAMEKKVSVIVIDYLGLVDCKKKFERHELKQSYIVKELAQLAIELDCTVLVLSQINRGVANDEDRCPWPHHASDSSGGHKSSSYWLGVDRPELYKDDPCYQNQFVIKCRKNRFGELFELILAFNGGTFAEVQPGWFKQPIATPKSNEKRLFSARHKDFTEN